MNLNFLRPSHGLLQKKYVGTAALQLSQWFSSAAGERTALLEQQLLAQMLRRCWGENLCYMTLMKYGLDLSGHSAIRHAVRLYSPDLESLAHQTTDDASVILELEDWPLSDASCYSILLQHTLDIAEHPQQVVREVARVLAPGGLLIVLGFNPWSLWRGQQQLQKFLMKKTACIGQWIGAYRLTDWLHLLNFDVEIVYRSQGRAVYGLVAKKRNMSMKLEKRNSALSPTFVTVSMASKNMVLKP